MNTITNPEEINVKKRAIVLDTETTGFDPESGDRVVEIGAVETVDYLPTGKELHIYINPLRDVPIAAQEVHGLTTEFLADFQPFEDIADQFVSFIGDAPIIAHNADFDAKFLNHELKLANKPQIAANRVIDSLAIARKKFPGKPNSLDALCKRFKINLASRDKHGALIDSKLLAEVYLELMGGRQQSFGLFVDQSSKEQKIIVNVESSAQNNQIVIKPNEEELLAHKLLLEKMKNPIWNNI